jgi:hypothetical protein
MIRLPVDVSFRRAHVRGFFSVVLLVSLVGIAYGATGPSPAEKAAIPEAPQTENHTVITQSGRAGNIVAYAPNGSVVYYNDSRTKYYDVDPVANESMTVEYVATDTIYEESERCRKPPCAYNVVERANLSTGEVTEVYGRYVYREKAGEWHDVDRVDERHLVVADMTHDSVWLVDTTTGMREWTWDAQTSYPIDEGGRYPDNWVHLNDVEILSDDRVMASLRNQDQVVFIDSETGIDHNWTLGSENDFSVLHRQHNPDYIPAKRGGPAVLVSDSENDRIVEYQRTNRSWTQSWVWADDRLDWARDADRLPNGNTLVVDTDGERVVEVNRTGGVVWQVDLPHPYDAERLETGDESTGGHSAASLGLESRQPPPDDTPEDSQFGILQPLVSFARDLLPTSVTNYLVDTSPAWFGVAELRYAVAGLTAGLVWALIEARWLVRSRDLGLRSPVYRRE